MKSRVLCVDDDPSVLEGFRRVLNQQFEVWLAIGADQGLEKLAAGLEFNVVISDLRMPGMDGMEFLKQVKLKHPDCERLMLTGNCDNEELAIIQQEGIASRVLVKPCGVKDLRTAISEADQAFQARRQPAA